MSISAKAPETETLRIARVYAALGWSVVPVSPGNKLPAVEWARFQHDPADDAQLEDWFSIGGYGIGLVQGAVAGTIVLDFDGETGQETRQRLEREHGDFPNTVEALTPGGGCHVVLDHPGRPVPTVRKLLPGMDVRGDGGFIVAHPSQHVNGRRYEWDLDHHPEEVAVAACPEWVATLVCDAAPMGGSGQDEPMVHHLRPGPLGMSENVIADGRETYMRDTVLAVLRELRDTLQRLPTEAELFDAVWPQYSRKVDLTRPGRGANEVRAKCRYTLARVMAGIVKLAPMAAAPVEPAAEAQHDPETGELILFPATPLAGMDLDHIPPRAWLYGRELLKGFVSLLGSPGGVGKTAYALAVLFSIAANRALLSPSSIKVSPYLAVHKPGPAWYYNLEDPADEMRRRIKALLMFHKLTTSDLQHPVYIDSGRDRALIVTRRDERGNLIAHPVVDALVAELVRRGIVLLVVDPFVQSHTAIENRNEEMNLVMALWGQVAHQAGCAVWLVHHFRKGGEGGDSEAFRGAGAIQGAARVMSTLSAMSIEEASKLGIEPDQRRQFVRLDNAKANMAPSADRAEWYRLASVNINNGTDAYPDGDSVQAIQSWDPPSPWEGLSWATIARVLSTIQEGPSPDERYALNKQARDRWAGHVVKDLAGKTDGQASAILKAWVENGVLEVGQYASPAQKGGLTGCVSVNKARATEMQRTANPGAPDDF